MKKTMLCGLLAAAALCFPARAAETVPVQVDGLQIEGPAYLESGVTYTPLRSLLNALGGWELHWDSDTKTAVGSSGTARLSADPDAGTVTINGTVYSGKVSVLKGRTYVPLRLTVEALSCRCAWDPWMRGAAVTSAEAERDAVDYYWLSRVIYAESGAESIEGQIAVGNVVMNRVKSEEFPNSIPAVVFDKKNAVQFEPVANGTIYQTPSEQAMEAARRVLAGENTAGAALYFYAPALSQGLWINDSRTYQQTIGCHRFYS